MPRPYQLDPEAVASINARRLALGWSLQRLAMACDPPLTEGACSKYTTLRTCMSPQIRARLERALAEAEQRGQGHQQEARAV